MDIAGVRRADFSPETGSRADFNTAVLQALAVFMMITLVPAAVFYFFPLSSATPGLAAACLFVIIACAVGFAPVPEGRRTTGWLLIVGGITFLVGAHLVIGMLFVPMVIGRFIGSLVPFAIMLIGAFFVYNALCTWPIQAIERAASIMRFVFVGIALLSVSGVQPPSYGIAVSIEKSVFPFAEPSHFAIAFTPFLLHACLRNRGWRRYAWLGTGFVIAYLLQSMSLVVGMCLTALLSVPIIPLSGLVGGFLMAASLIDISYYTDRLDFSDQSRNLSTLVYIQGWELAGDSLDRTWGWGIGFQQLGYGVINSPTAELVFRMIGNDSNLRDGGFVAAKLVSEFGVVGIALIAVYATVAARAGWKLRRYALGSASAGPSLQIFASSMTVGYAVEMFVRGIGYFSPGGVFSIASVLVLWTLRGLPSQQPWKDPRTF